jgi:hypothetical protein
MCDEAAEAEQGGAVDSTVASGNVILGQQSFEYASIQIQVEDAAHQRRVEQQRLDHELIEKAKDNELHRNRFWLVVGLLVAILVVAGAVGIGHDQEETRRWAQNVVTTMIGGLLGAIAGYFTAKGGN